MGREIRVAMLGIGFIAGFRAQVYAKIPDVKVVSVLGRDMARTKKFAEENQIYYAATTFADLLKGPDFEAVDICLPNNLHLEMAVKAARSGKHIICEKPLGRTAAEAQIMLQEAENAGIIHCYGENLFFSPDMQEILSIIDRGIIGQPLWMRGREGHSGPHSAWFYDRSISGGGALLDMGCHLIGVFNQISQEKATTVFAFTPTLHHRTDCEDNSLTIIRYGNKLFGQVEASWTQRGGMQMLFEVWGDEGMISYDRSALSQPIKVFALKKTNRYFSEKVEHNQGWLFPTVQEYWRYGYYDEIQHFIECLQEKKEPILTFKEGYEVNRIIDKAYSSYKSGKWEDLD